VRWEPNLKIRDAVQMQLLLKKEKGVYIFHISVVTGIILGDRTSQVCVLDTEKYSASVSRGRTENGILKYSA
jgi:hypothetical protein